MAICLTNQYPILFEFQLAKRLYKSKSGERRISKPAVIIAVAGIAIGMVVMILTLAIVIGFKSNIKDKISGFNSDIVVANYNSIASLDANPIVTDAVVIDSIYKHSNVKHIQRFTSKVGMIKTDNSFEGILLKGVGQEYDTSFFKSALLMGRLPQFTDSVSSNEVLLSQTLCNILDIKLDDRIYAYFAENKGVKARRLTVVGIYQTNYYDFDKLYAITDIHLLNRLNKWNADQSSGLEIKLNNFSKLEDTTYDLSELYAGHQDKYGEHYVVMNVEQLNESLFGWLELLDMNIWVILILMMAISGFTIISGLLIIILERTQMIGLLKGLGATNGSIRKVFIYLATFLVVKGLLIGNAVGLLICFVQHNFGILKLDPTVYYIDRVPVSISLWWIVVLNVSVMFISVVMLLGPSFIITKINPATSMRYE